MSVDNIPSFEVIVSELSDRLNRRDYEVIAYYYDEQRKKYRWHTVMNDKRHYFDHRQEAIGAADAFVLTHVTGDVPSFSVMATTLAVRIICCSDAIPRCSDAISPSENTQRIKEVIYDWTRSDIREMEANVGEKND